MMWGGGGEWRGICNTKEGAAMEGGGGGAILEQSPFQS